MIQRIQSIWLFLAGVAIFLMLVIPVISASQGSKEFWIKATGLYQQENGMTTKLESFNSFYISVIAVGIICLWALFSFKKRTQQKRMCIYIIVLIFLLSFLVFRFAQKIPGGVVGANCGAGAVLPVLSVLFCVLAIRGIRKDEQLLKSADRLR